MAYCTKIRLAYSILKPKYAWSWAERVYVSLEQSDQDKDIPDF
jgi:hypothetical protein